MIYSVSPAAIRLRVGSSRRDAGGRVVRVARVAVHPQYGRPQFDHDVAALRLARPLPLGPNIRAVALPPPRQPVPLVTLTVTGWGLTAVSTYSYQCFLARRYVCDKPLVFALQPSRAREWPGLKTSGFELK